MIPFPQRGKLLCRRDGAWQAVQTSDAFGVAKDRFNKVSFAAVAADALRIEVKLQPGFSSGILRMHAY